MQNDNQLFKVFKDTYGGNIVTYEGKRLEIKNRFALGTGESFSWGDTSSASEALAYAILYKVGSREIASRFAKTYTKKVISRIAKEQWTLSASAVIQWINEHTNYIIDESTYLKTGEITYQYKERRHEQRRQGDRRNEENPQIDSKQDRRKHERRGEDRRAFERREEEERLKEERRIQREKEFLEEAQRRLKQREEKFQEEVYSQIPQSCKEELESCKRKILQQEQQINNYILELKKYKTFIDSLDIKSIYERFSALENDRTSK